MWILKVGFLLQKEKAYFCYVKKQGFLLKCHVMGKEFAENAEYSSYRGHHYHSLRSAGA
jgi:hypothetical protein